MQTQLCRSTILLSVLVACLIGCGGGQASPTVREEPGEPSHRSSIHPGAPGDLPPGDTSAAEAEAPLVGVTGYVLEANPDEGARRGSFRMTRTYRDALVGAGAIAVHLVPVPSTDVSELVGRLDGLVLAGGPDIYPDAYGEDPHSSVVPVPRERQEFDLALIREAMARRIPILGICLGSQEINIALGGSLIQDIPTEVEGDVGHRRVDPEEVEHGAHEIEIVPGTPLAELYGTSNIRVNSLHHQASDQLGAGLEIAARASDGVIEGFFLPGYPYLIGVQFHPEMQEEPEALHENLFQSFIRAAETYRSGRSRTGRTGP